MLQSILFGAGQSGVGTIADIDSGFLSKLLTTPVSRMAILLGRVAGDLTRMLAQATIVVALGWVFGQFQTPVSPSTTASPASSERWSSRSSSA